MEEGAKIARTWMEKCLTKHRKCGVPQTSHLPKRTIFVGSSNNDIYLSDNGNASGIYLCLSHCWGRFQPLTTTSSNLRDHHSQIPWSSLPKTFQDAISFTRALGIKHIWIDSLCIIQDSLSDWAIESSKMAEIYSNACGTLAATASSDGRGGLFRHHSSDELKSKQIFLTRHHRTTVFARARVHDMSTQPLLERGWVFQEQLLSKRILYFNEYELAWQCRTKVTCECNRRSPPPVMKWTDLPQDYMWEQLVYLYSCLELTKMDDRLPALSGIAQAFQAGAFKKHGRTGGPGKYCAGIWERDFVNQLCWTVNHGVAKVPLVTPGKELEEYKAPSWSWASVDQVVNFEKFRIGYEYELRAKAEVVSINCVPRTQNPYGPVKIGSYADIKVRLFPATLHYNENMQFIHPREDSPGERTAKNSLFWGRESGVNIALDDQGLPDVFERDIFLAVVHLDVSTNDYESRILILEACGVIDKLDCFKRLGLLLTTIKNDLKYNKIWNSLPITIRII